MLDSRRIPLGTGLFSSSSQIALRLVSREAALTRAAYLAEVRTRVHAALELRERLAPASAENNACRLVFSEADGLPGIRCGPVQRLVSLLTAGAGDGAGRCARAAAAEVLRER